MQKLNLSSDTKRSTILGLSLVALVAGSSCATTALLDSDVQKTTYTTTVKKVLIEDQLLAFGRPDQPLPNMPSDSVVIVGEKNSYVLNKGGAKMVNILTNLTPENIQVDNDMSFYSPNNDGTFQGLMSLSYAKLIDDLPYREYQFFDQNGGRECTKPSDERMGAKRFCFTVSIQGGVYPAVSNLDLIQSKYNALTKPYSVTIYTTKAVERTSESGFDTVEKIALFPFAVAFDVVTFPFVLLSVVE